MKKIRLAAVTIASLLTACAYAQERFEVTFQNEAPIFVSLTAAGNSERDCPATSVTSPTTPDGVPRAKLQLFRFCDGTNEQRRKLYGKLVMQVVEFRHLQTADGHTDVTLPVATSTVEQKFGATLDKGDRIEVRHPSQDASLAVIRRVE